MLISVSVSISRANIIKSIYKFIEIFFYFTKKSIHRAISMISAVFPLILHSKDIAHRIHMFQFIGNIFPVAYKHTLLNTAQQQLYYASNTNTYNDTRDRIKTAVSCYSH